MADLVVCAFCGQTWYFKTPWFRVGCQPAKSALERQKCECKGLTPRFLEGNQTQAAQRLGISRSTLWRKMKEYNIDA